MAHDLAAAQILNSLNLGRGNQTIIPPVLSLRQIDEPLVSPASGPVGLVMKTADKINLARKDQARAVRHRWRLRATDNIELDFKTVFLRDARLLENSEERQMRGIAGQ